MIKRVLEVGGLVVAVAGIAYIIKHNESANKKVNDWVDAALDKFAVDGTDTNIGGFGTHRKFDEESSFGEAKKDNDFDTEFEGM